MLKFFFQREVEAWAEGRRLREANVRLARAAEETVARRVVELLGLLGRLRLKLGPAGLRVAVRLRQVAVGSCRRRRLVVRARRRGGWRRLSSLLVVLPCPFLFFLGPLGVLPPLLLGPTVPLVAGRPQLRCSLRTHATHARTRTQESKRFIA